MQWFLVLISETHQHQHSILECIDLAVVCYYRFCFFFVFSVECGVPYHPKLYNNTTRTHKSIKIPSIHSSVCVCVYACVSVCLCESTPQNSLGKMFVCWARPTICVKTNTSILSKVYSATAHRRPHRWYEPNYYSQIEHKFSHFHTTLAVIPFTMFSLFPNVWYPALNQSACNSHWPKREMENERERERLAECMCVSVCDCYR